MNLPEGWKLVPIEPTLEMCKAMDDATGPHSTSYSNWKWKEALAVAPTPPAQEDENNPIGYISAEELLSNNNSYQLIWPHKTDAKNLPVYTFPQDDKLRGAAEDLIEIWETPTGSISDLVNKINPVIENLRAALEGK